MINLLGTHDRIAQVEHAKEVLESADAHLHIYGKLKSRPGRKMGHMTLLGDNLDQTYKEALRLTQNIQI
jgi:5-(carboxyamino)imidazole ribonucleotide synthase